MYKTTKSMESKAGIGLVKKTKLVSENSYKVVAGIMNRENLTIIWDGTKLKL